jgi:transposase
MIAEDLRSRIRRLFFAEHWKVGTIAAQLGVHHDTVTNAIESSRFVNVQYRGHRDLLDPYKPFVNTTLEQYPRLRSTRLLEMIVGRGYTGTIYPLRRYVRDVRPVPRDEAYLRLVTLPGEQAQVDWASFGHIRIGRATRALSCFLLVLSWSRALFARFFLDQTLESFLRGHTWAFERMKGVPREILYDNLKSVVLERQGDIVRFNPTLLECAGHYHFAPKPCAVARGNEKGRVERRVRDLRESFFAARRFDSVEDLNAQLDTWTERVQRARLRPADAEARTVRDALLAEQERLLSLPEHPFPTAFVRAIASGKTPYVRFDRNDYSIPHTLVKRSLSLVASDTTVRILDGDDEVACHRRSWDAGATIEDERHLRALSEQKKRARELRGRHRLTTACPAAAAFLGQVALQGGHLGGTTSRLLRLLDQYGADGLDHALSEAHQRGAISAQSVAHILDQRRRAAGSPVPLDVILPDRPGVRDLVVTPHSLASYDCLARRDDTPPADDDGGGGDRGDEGGCSGTVGSVS